MITSNQKRNNHKPITYIQINPKDNYVPNKMSTEENQSNIILFTNAASHVFNKL